MHNPDYPVLLCSASSNTNRSLLLVATVESLVLGLLESILLASLEHLKMASLLGERAFGQGDQTSGMLLSGS